MAASKTLSLRPRKYILDRDGNPVPEPDFLKWSNWFDNRSNRIVARHDLPGAVRIITIFLGVDHNTRDSGPPVLWQTKISGGDYNGLCVWYTSHQSALEGHQKALTKALQALADD